MIFKRSLKLYTLTALLTLSLGLACFGPACAKHGSGGKWVTGDFHQHTLYTDGSTTFDFVMGKNVEFGLDWWANSEHGGARNRDGNGQFWDDPAFYPVNPILGDVAASGGHQVMWRWQSLRDFVFPGILETRTAYPSKRIFSGLEWNVPGHEHCSTAIVGRDASAISAFEYQFDGSDTDTSRNGEVTPFGTLSKQNGQSKPYPDKHTDSVAACAWMQEQFKQKRVDNGWIIYAHIERDGVWSADDGGGYNVEHFRDFNNAAPDICFGFEGAPGHQANKWRGFGNAVTTTPRDRRRNQEQGFRRHLWWCGLLLSQGGRPLGRTPGRRPAVVQFRQLRLSQAPYGGRRRFLSGRIPENLCVRSE